MKARNAELSMLILATVIAAGTLALVDLAERTTVAPESFGFALMFSGLAFAGHLAVRRYAPTADPVLYPLAVVLAGFGLGMIRRLSPDLASAQLGWFAISIGAFVLTLAVVRNHRTLEQFRYLLMLAGIGLLLLPLTPIGTDLDRSARLWVQLGGMTFQPAEIAKIVLATFLAGYLASKREVMNISTLRLGPIGVPAPRHFGPLVLAWILSLAVMFYERDLGSSLLFFSLFIVMLYVATSRGIYVFTGFAMFGAGVWYAYKSFPHISTRVCAWLDPWSTNINDPCGILQNGRQIAQSAFALGTGGFTGVGLGLGHPEQIDPGLASGTLPTDFIFAAIGEELGLLGTVAVLLLFGLIVARGMHIALRSRDTFGTLLAAGLTVIVGLQAFLIMAGVSRMLPLTGITLPFISYGGSSLLANFVLIALLVRISNAEGAS
ncbi:MAG TPA: FtsW/RodA/SpoVE family cell cycle protein [Actinomycetota bacterium]